MSTYNTAYKSGTFNGAPSSGATTFTVAGFTPAAGDVGRLIIITNGNGRLQHREITAVSGQDITIAHAWDSNPFVDPTDDQRASDVLPSNGDAFAISYDAEELAATDSDISLSDNNHMVLSGTLRVQGNAYIHFKGLHVQFNSANIEVSGVSNGGGLIFGYYKYVENQDGYYTDFCNLVDVTTSGTSGDQMASGNGNATSFGLLDIYGGTLKLDPGNGFWRTYRDLANSAKVQCRWIGLQIDGSFGSRVDGNRSIIVVTNVNSSSNIGIVNPRTAVARVELTSLNSSQAGYVFLSQGPSGRATFNRLVDISTRLFRVASSGGAGEVYEAIGKKSEIDQIPVFAVVEGGTSSHTMRYGNLIKPSYIDAAGALISTTLKTRLYDANNDFIAEEILNDGQYPETFARHTDWATSSGTKTFSNGTLYAPYALRAIEYNKQFNATTIDVEDTFGSNVVLLNDNLITESTKAIVDAYTQLDTPEKLYDRAKAYLYDNITDESALLCVRNGNTIDFGSYNVINDSTAGSAFSLSGNDITVDLSLAFTGNITTTGTYTDSGNGEIVLGTITSSNVNQTTLPFSITGLVANSRVQVYNVTAGIEISNTVVAGTSSTGTYIEGVDFTVGDTIRIRATNAQGLVAYQGFETTAVASSSGWSVLADQKDDSIYNTIGVDGSTVTEFDHDFVNNEIDIVVAANFSAHRLYARYVYFTTLPDGIRLFFGAVEAVDLANIKNDVTVLDMFLNNNTSTNLIQTDNVRLYKSNGVYPARTATTGGGGIDVVWRDKIFIAETGTSGLTPSESAKLMSLDTSNLDTTVSSRSSTFELSTVNDNIINTGNSNWATATGFSTFDPSTDTVANVTNVANNADMRGTDGANTIAPENGKIANIEELVDELHKLQGLDASNPMTVTPTSRTTGRISQTISGDGQTTTTVTRD